MPRKGRWRKWAASSLATATKTAVRTLVGCETRLATISGLINQVFRDIDRIRPGERFPRVIEQAVASCDALLAVIGPTGISVEDENGRRRLLDPNDYLRQEIAAALKRDDVKAMPVLIGPAQMPARRDLPQSLALSPTTTPCACRTKGGRIRFLA